MAQLLSPSLLIKSRRQRCSPACFPTGRAANIQPGAGQGHVEDAEQSPPPQRPTAKVFSPPRSARQLCLNGHFPTLLPQSEQKPHQNRLLKPAPTSGSSGPEISQSPEAPRLAPSPPGIQGGTHPPSSKGVRKIKAGPPLQLPYPPALGGRRCSAKPLSCAFPPDFCPK